MRTLVLDIETAPNLAHVWGLFKQDIGLNQIIEPGYVLCWAAKWLGEDETYYRSLEHDGQHKMLKHIWALLDKADAVIHYNGTKFDIPTLNREFILAGMEPPDAYRQIDLLQVCKKQFSFPSNRLDYVARALKIGKKVKHYGHELWIQCMNHDDAAWEVMKKYNIQDTELTEQLYWRLQPWIKGHPNRNLYGDLSEPCCTNCGATKLHKKGSVYTNAGMYQRYRCPSCGANMRGRINQLTREQKENLVLPLLT